MKTKTRIRAGRITLSHNQADLRTMETRQGRIHDDFNSHSRLGRSVVLSTLASLFIFAGTVAAQNFTIFIEWPIPGTFPEPLEFASSGNNGAYFSEYLGNKIGFLDINKNVITEWTLPPGTYPLRMVSQGQKVAFAEAIQNGKIGLLDPNGSSLTEWAIPQISDRVPFPKRSAVRGSPYFSMT
ncbi:MAG TPA: hypothetical protein VKE70_26700 [Candidatus Solibacter sp.]|nr:hypothetical protein [Candidatus Solibacter sp.]